MCRKGSVTEKKKTGRDSQRQVDAGVGKREGIDMEMSIKSHYFR